MTTPTLERPRPTTPPQDPTRHPAPLPATPGLLDRLAPVENLAVRIARRFGATALRVTLGLIFVWFGALKITGDTPVADFVANTVNWVPLVEGWWFVPVLGIVEVALGAALILGLGLRLILPVLFAHLTGTFLSVVTQPEVLFMDGNLALLTMEGEFVVKNLILLAGVLVIYAGQHLRPTTR